MATYGEDYDTIRRRNQSYFPAVNFGQAPGMAEGQARMDALASTGTYKSRQNDFRNKYPQLANPTAQQNLQQFDVGQAYAKGYGAPNPTIQQGPGGAYRVAGGVAAPYNPPNAFQRFNSDVATTGRGIGAIASGLGTFAANAFPNITRVLGLNSATRYGQNVSTGQYGAQPVAQPASAQQGYSLYANNPSTQPRSYFDPTYNYNF